MINPLGMLGEHEKSLWVYHAGKLIEKVFYCFYEITMLSACKERALRRSSSLFSLHLSHDARKPIKAAVRMNELDSLLLKKHCQIHAGSTKVTTSFENYQLKFIS